MSRTELNLPQGWCQTTLASIVTHKSGNSKLIKGKLHNMPEIGRYQGYSASGADVWCDHYEHDGNAIIVSAVGHRCGKAFLAEGKWSAIANTHIVQPNTHILDHKYIYYLLNNENFWVRGGSAQPFVKAKATFERPFSLPPLPEQRRIVAKIESLQERSSRARAALAEVGPLLEQFRRSVLSAAFSGRLTADWRAANPDVEPASELLHRIRTERRQRWEQAELAKYEAKGKKPAHNWRNRYTDPLLSEKHNHTDLPASWCWARLSDICTIQGGHAFKSSDYAKQGTPLVRIGDLTDGIVNISNRTKHLPLSFLNYYPDYILKHGDILIAMSGATTGKMAVYQDEQPALLNQRVGRFIPHSPKEVHRPYLRALVENMGAVGLVAANC